MAAEDTLQEKEITQVQDLPEENPEVVETPSEMEDLEAETQPSNETAETQKELFSTNQTHVITETGMNADTENEKDDEKGRVTLSIEFSEDELEEAEEWIRTAKEIGEAWIERALEATEDEDKIELLNSALEASRQTNTDEFFVANQSGTVLMEVPVANGTLEFDDGTRLQTDEDGFYSTQGFSKGKYAVTLSKAGVLNLEDTIEIRKDEDSECDINFSKTSEEINASLNKMASGMSEEVKENKIVLESKVEIEEADVSLLGNDSTIGEYYGKLKTDKESSIIGTSGRGTSRYAEDGSNRPKCQKSDKNLGDSSKFPLNSSDCATSIGLGFMAFQDPALYPVYFNSTYCVDECFSALPNIYCNGKNTMRDDTSKNNHMNCSWFNGIGHTENMHIHSKLFLNSSKSEWKPNCKTQSTTSTITTNYNYWNAKTLDSWITVSPKSGDPDGKLTVKVAENKSTTSRIGTVTITTGNLKQTIKVTQAKKTAFYTVSYNSNGGAGTFDSQTKVEGVSLKLRETKPVRSGYYFAGWGTSKNATTVAYQAGDSYTANKSVTLYAIWKRTYEIRYDANGGKGVPANQLKKQGTTLKLSATKPTRSGYTFAGWSTSKSATTANYQAGGSYTANAAATLYAVWKRNYTISYHANGGSGAPASQTKVDGIILKLTTKQPSRSGYTFAGWTTIKGAKVAAYLPGGNYYANKNTTLYAVWKRNYTISYYANGGSGAPASQKKVEGTTVTLSSKKPTRSGYTYAGWSTSKTGNSASYQPGSSYSRDASLTLYAVWKLNYTVSYNANGGSGAPSAHTKVEGVALKLKTGKPTRSGYTFTGWSTIKSATIAAYHPGGNYYANGNATLYAVWKKNYRITYYANGGSGGPSSQIKMEGVALKMSTSRPTRSGYKFTGWSSNRTAKTGFYQPGQYYYGNTPLTLYAIWKKK